MAIAAEMVGLTREQMLQMFRSMAEIRAFEYRAYELYREGVMRGTTHAYVGEEAIAVGVCSALREDDTITSTHRGHGHCIAKGGDMSMMMAELLGKETGYSSGKGGSMHIADVDKGILGANGIVGGGMGIATGAGALGQAARQRPGRGLLLRRRRAEPGHPPRVDEPGRDLEAAGRLRLREQPVRDVGPGRGHDGRARSVRPRGGATASPASNVDGMDVLAVFRAASEAVERARRGEGPSFIVATTYRFLGHHVGDPLQLPHARKRSTPGARRTRSSGCART